ncbi:MAG: class I SAM-dependent methyltransferase [Deltaproteobacteria bacterium]|nr:class I SAM-dependent methyltransferase [Deltaproteobacteria bacterium]
MNTTEKSGSSLEFDANWRNRPESYNNYWIAQEPVNQIQLAFRMHWHLFSELIGGVNAKRCLEVGCGRGSISSYFAANGCDCTLLDTSSNVLQIARQIFHNSGHIGRFVTGDANHLPFPSNTFDVVVSIGLLEHFKNVVQPIHEQIRVLRPSGIFLGYIVPEQPDNIQKYFRWLNFFLKIISQAFGISASSVTKTPIYRNDFGSERYLPILIKEKVVSIEAMGVYPLPMISHSPEFPFSLLPAFWEKLLTKVFSISLTIRRSLSGRNPWICQEKTGQAFLVVCRKREG